MTANTANTVLAERSWFMADDQTERDYLEDAGKRLISLAEAAKRCGLSADHLRRLMERGAIRGQKIGRNWVTTEAAVREYLALSIRPGPKRKES